MHYISYDFSIKFKRPIPLDGEIKAITKLTEENKRIFKGTGKIILSDGKIAATAEGRYLKLPIENIADFDREENEWKIIASPDDPKIIEIIDKLS